MNEPDPNTGSGGNAAFMMGEIRSDVKHILAALTQVHTDQRDLAERIGAVEGELSSRITTVERSYWRITGMAAVAIPAATLAVNWLVSHFGV